MGDFRLGYSVPIGQPAATEGVTMMTTREEIEAAMEDLQRWFARRPYGWRERATEDQVQQWDDRSAEYDRLQSLLEQIG